MGLFSKDDGKFTKLDKMVSGDYRESTLTTNKTIGYVNANDLPLKYKEEERQKKYKEQNRLKKKI